MLGAPRRTTTRIKPTPGEKACGFLALRGLSAAPLAGAYISLSNPTSKPIAAAIQSVDTPFNKDITAGHTERNAAIVTAYATGSYSYRKIAEHFNIHLATVGRIVRKAMQQWEN